MTGRDIHLSTFFSELFVENYVLGNVGAPLGGTDVEEDQEQDDLAAPSSSSDHGNEGEEIIGVRRDAPHLSIA